MQEPEYIDGDSFDSEFDPRKPPKWMIPTNDWEEYILSAVGMTKFPSEKQQRLTHSISTNCYSLSERECKFPEEWIRSCCSWARRKREKGEMVQLSGLLSLLYNEARRDQFIEKWVEDHRDEMRRFSPRR
jgi:hypothetical protein